MKVWEIPVYYTMAGTINVEANTLEEAIEIAKDKDGIIPLPDDADYLDGSWEVSDLGNEEIRALYNENQEDET